MEQNIGIVGAGICGLSSALALSKHDYNITIYERDSAPPVGSPDEAFFQWSRRGAAQFRHPHAFLGVMCNLLRTPRTSSKTLGGWGQKVSFEDMIPEEIKGAYAPKPDDKQMWLCVSTRHHGSVLRKYVENTVHYYLSKHEVVAPDLELRDSTISLQGLRFEKIGAVDRLNLM